MKMQTVKKPKAVTPKKIGKAVAGVPKLSKADPDYYAKIGAISAAMRKLSSEFFSEMARKSHGPDSARDGYYGGRKKKTVSE